LKTYQTIITAITSFLEGNNLCQEVNSDGKPGSVISSNVTSASTDEKLYGWMARTSLVHISAV